MSVAITAISHHVPPEVIPNRFFEDRLDTTDRWIQERTGIRERRIAPGQSTSDLILPAALDCLSRRGLAPDDIDCILVATITPDHACPSTATVLQRKLCAFRAWGFDISAACSGFIFGLQTARALLESGHATRVLLCAADRMTILANPEDRSTAVLFGDAATATLLERVEGADEGILSCICQVDPDEKLVLSVPAGGSAQPTSIESVRGRAHYLRMDGQAVFRAAVAGTESSAKEVLARWGIPFTQPTTTCCGRPQ